VVYEERAKAWTEAPATVSALWKQRYRWSYGTMQAIWKHRRAVLDRESWAVGRLAIPSMVLFQVVFPVLAPLLDLWVLHGLLFLDPAPVLVAWVAFTAAQVALAAYAFRLDGESLRPLWAVPVQQFAYRQLMYLVVIQSTVTAVMGIRLPWQPMERTGAINDGADGVAAAGPGGGTGRAGDDGVDRARTPAARRRLARPGTPSR
jgi:cellulose synthase/poly-beta-1,6-N-acetylglucosamine synthase-like glycosyltransferase